MSDVIQEIDNDALDALIGRLNEAKEFDLTLSAEDIQLLLHALKTLAIMQTRLSSHDVTIHKLRKLVGIVAASENLGALLENHSSSGSGKPNKSKKIRQKKKLSPTRKPNVEHHVLDSLNKGDRCPTCQLGTLSKYEPVNLLRITGNSPYTAINHVLERLRCNACGEYFTASVPDDVRKDGDIHQKYGYSARSMMAIGKYFMGSPFYRQETLQAILGLPITASTVYDQCEKVADSLYRIYKTLIYLAANGLHFYLDDTTHHILDQKEIMKIQRKTKKPNKRTGTYASGLIATLDNGKHITLFQTNIGHAGEWIDDVLEKRDPGRAPPLLMSDALSSNQPSVTQVIPALCNSHGRRQFVDVLTHFPEDVEYVLNLYKTIWVNEDLVNEKQLNAAQRLAYHQEHSLPSMKTIRDWGERQLATMHVEANSGLGKAIRYFLSHYDGLTRFCTVEGAMIDNNWMEAQLKLIVRGRKNFSFYKTQLGATISDIITSVIATCVNAQVNPFDYLVVIQQNQDQVNTSPETWLPWNYQRNT